MLPMFVDLPLEVLARFIQLFCQALATGLFGGEFGGQAALLDVPVMFMVACLIQGLFEFAQTSFQFRQSTGAFHPLSSLHRSFRPSFFGANRQSTAPDQTGEQDSQCQGKDTNDYDLHGGTSSSGQIMVEPGFAQGVVSPLQI